MNDDKLIVVQSIHDFIDSGRQPQNKYPGVTRVLSGTKDESGLLEWRKRVGEEEAERILRESHVIGTSLDRLVMSSFDESFVQEDYKDEPGYDLYRQLKAPLLKVDPIALQLKVWSDKLRVMGYLDIIGFYDGVLTLIDVKNTRTTKQRKYVEDYFLQCTLYCMMLYDLLGIEVKQIGLLIADRSNTAPQIFIERTKDHVREALHRVAQYHAAQPAGKAD